MTEKELLKRVIEENLANKEAIRQRVLSAVHNESYTEKTNEDFSAIIRKKAIFIPVSICLAFVVMVNTSSSFANTVSNIPVLNSIARVITIREYTHDSDADKTHVKIPKISNTGNSELENRINKEIYEKIQDLATKAEVDAKEYKENYLKCGNKESNFIPMTYDFDYKVYFSSDDILSFVVTQTELNNTSQKYLDEVGVPEKAEYITQYMYNIDLETGKDITLKDLFGKEYKRIVDKEIETQVKERAKKDRNLLYYYEKFYAYKGAKGIEENQQFYINKSGNPVIVFDKYIIAPEYAGIQEFEIKK